VKHHELPCVLVVERDDENIVTCAYLNVGGTYAFPFKYVRFGVSFDDFAHLSPRPNAEWKSVDDKDYAGGGYIMCTACKYKFSFGAYNMLDHERFCPRCGAFIGKGGDSDNDRT